MRSILVRGLCRLGAASVIGLILASCGGGGGGSSSSTGPPLPNPNLEGQNDPNLAQSTDVFHNTGIEPPARDEADRIARFGCNDCWLQQAAVEVVERQTRQLTFGFGGNRVTVNSNYLINYEPGSREFTATYPLPSYRTTRPLPVDDGNGIRLRDIPFIVSADTHTRFASRGYEGLDASLETAADIEADGTALGKSSGNKSLYLEGDLQIIRRNADGSAIELSERPDPNNYLDVPTGFIGYESNYAIAGTFYALPDIFAPQQDPQPLAYRPGGFESGYFGKRTDGFSIPGARNPTIYGEGGFASYNGASTGIFVNVGYVIDPSAGLQTSPFERSFMFGTVNIDVDFDNREDDAVAGWVELAAWNYSNQNVDYYDDNNDARRDTVLITLTASALRGGKMRADARVSRAGSGFLSSITLNTEGYYDASFFGSEAEELAGAGYVGEVGRFGGAIVQFGFIGRRGDRVISPLAVDAVYEITKSNSFDVSPDRVLRPTIPGLRNPNLPSIGCFKCIVDVGVVPQGQYRVNNAIRSAYNYLVVYDGLQTGLTVVYTDDETVTGVAQAGLRVRDKRSTLRETMNRIATEGNALRDTLVTLVGANDGPLFFEGEVDGLNVGYLSYDAEYSQLGLWYESPDLFDDTENSGYAGAGSRLDAYVARFGLLTPPGEVQQTGTARYEGYSIGSYFITRSDDDRTTSGNERGYLFGTSAININFNAGGSTSAFSGNVRMRPWDFEINTSAEGSEVNLELMSDVAAVAIRDNEFIGTTVIESATGTLSEFAGQGNGFFRGAFYGPGGVEIAGAGTAGVAISTDSDTRGDRTPGPHLNFGFIAREDETP